MIPLLKTLDELRYEYECMSGDSNPPKLSMALTKPDDDGSIRRYLNVMGAVLSDGTFGSKTVMIDEWDGKTAGDVLHYDMQGNQLYTLPSSLVTPLRCALMAAVAMSYRESLTQRNVIIIGGGELGVAIANVLWELRHKLNIASRIKVVCSSEGRKTNIDRMPYAIPISKQKMLDYGEPTTLISCTNNSGPLLEITAFSKIPCEVITFDSGGMLGASFRASHFSFCDHPKQLSEHLLTEFPADGEYLSTPREFLHRTQPLEYLSDLKANHYSASYIYGVAMADLIVGRAIWEHMTATGNKNRVYDNLLYGQD